MCDRISRDSSASPTVAIGSRADAWQWAIDCRAVHSRPSHRHTSALRLWVLLPLVGLLACLSPSSLALANWSVPLPKEANGTLTVAPNTTVFVGSCTDVTRSGGLLWQLPEVLDRTPDCMDAVTDSEGNTYTLTDESAGQPIVESLSPTGSIRWAVPTDGFTSFRTQPVLGANGSVFFSMWNGAYAKVVGYNEQTGAITLEHQFYDVTGLHAYSGGLMVVNTDSQVIYLGYEGTVLAEYSTGPPISAYEAYSNAAGADGALFVAGYEESCGSESHASIEKFTPAGLAWTWTDKATYCTQTGLTATPDGGVIFARSEANPSADFTSLSATGTERWTDDMRGPRGPAQGAGYFPVRVDVNGVVALPAKILYGCPVQPNEECWGAQIELVSAQTGTTVFEPVQLQGSGEYGFNPYSDAIDAERLYVTGEVLEPSAVPTLDAFSISGLGKDYQVALEEQLTGEPSSPPPIVSGGSGGTGSSGGGSSGGGTSGSSPGSGCPAYMVIDSRGSGEASETISPPGQAFATEFQKLHHAARVAILANPYPALGLWGNWRDVLNLIGAKLGIGPLGAYHGSVVDGEQWLQTNIAAEIAACPGTKLLLTGYSQGAQVTGDVYQRDVSSSERHYIVAVVLFGDPYFNPTDATSDRGNFAHDGRGGVLGARRSFGGYARVLSYCHLHDPICQHPTIVGLARYRLKQHENYPPDAVVAAKHF
jgi:Cutinase